jgi:arginase
MPGPHVTIDLGKIEHNTQTITRLCGKYGIEVTGVTKVTCGIPQVAKAMLRGGVASIGESRMENIFRLKANGVNTTHMLLRIPPLSRVEEIVTSADISLNSELSVIAALSEAAHRRGLVHKIIIMVDLGDLREGVWPDDLLPLVREVIDLPGIRIVGLGTNLSCYGGVIPSEENMNQLVEYAHQMESSFGLKLQYISGGNSSSLNLIASGKMPKRVNHVRIGEGILLGCETVYRTPWPGTFQDAFLLHAEVIELKEKPSVPIGETSEDAFGGKPTFVDKGDMDRAILSIGREDVDIEGIRPIDSRLSILGASSDHLIMDVTDAQETIQVGDTLVFSLNYSALLAAMTSQYVEKRPLKGDQLERVHQGVMVIKILASDSKDHTKFVNTEGLIWGLNELGYSSIRQSDLLFKPERETSLLNSFSAMEEAVIHTATEVADKVTGALAEDYVPLVFGLDPNTCLGVYLGLARSPSVYGVIVLSAHGGFIFPEENVPIGRVVLGASLGYGDATLSNFGGLRPKLEAERVALIGLREAATEEARLITRSRITVFTMEDVDALGMREVIYRALHTASMGTDGIHVTLDMGVLDPGVSPGVIQPVKGGISYREGHLAMEMIARSGLLRSMAVVDFSPEKDVNGSTAKTATEYVLSAFGKKILRV